MHLCSGSSISRRTTISAWENDHKARRPPSVKKDYAVDFEQSTRSGDERLGVETPTL